MSGLRITVDADFGGTGWATGDAIARQEFVGGSGNAFVFDAKYPSSLFQDVEGTIPVTQLGDPVRRINDRSGQGRDAVLQPNATEVPIWSGDGNRRWVEVPLNSGFEVSNPMNTVSWSVVFAAQFTGVSGSGSATILSQYTEGVSGSFMPMQIGRSSSKLAINVAGASGFEVFSSQNMELGTDYVGELYKDMGVSSKITMNGVEGPLYTDGMTNQATVRPLTGMFFGGDNGTTTSGRLYYLAFKQAIRDTSELAKVASERSGVSIFP